VFRNGEAETDREMLRICAAPDNKYTDDGYKVLACAVRYETWEIPRLGVYYIVDEREKRETVLREKQECVLREKKECVFREKQDAGVREKQDCVFREKSDREEKAELVESSLDYTLDKPKTVSNNKKRKYQ